MAQYGFFFDQSRCYGCQACATACKDWNALEPGPEKWMTVYEWETGAFPSTRIHSLAFSCAHCESPACMAACSSGAIFKDDVFGAVLVDKEKCVGCRECAQACPFGAPKFASDNQIEKMSKCTMCIDKLIKGEKPQCVLSCPMRALDFGPLDDLVGQYGNCRSLEGMPEAAELGPAFVAKPSCGKIRLLPFDEKKVITLNAQRGDLPDLFESEASVSDVPKGIMFRDALRMRHDTSAELMRATQNDLG